MERPQKGVLTQCYLTPKDQACSFLCSLRIPLRSNTFIPFTYFLFFQLVYWTGFFCSSAQKNLYVLPTLFIYTWSLISLVDCSRLLRIENLYLLKNKIMQKNSNYLRTRACWRPLLIEKLHLLKKKKCPTKFYQETVDFYKTIVSNTYTKKKLRNLHKFPNPLMSSISLETSWLVSSKSFDVSKSSFFESWLIKLTKFQNL
jgi:hypothetical protein